MKIPVNAISARDFNGYFADCFLRDPISGRPARFVAAVDNHNGGKWPLDMTLELAKDDFAERQGDVVTYTGENTGKFYDTSLYNGYKLGYRSLDKGFQLLYLYQIPARIGVRGICQKRLGILDDPATALAYGSMVKMRYNFETVQGAKVIFDPKFMTIKDGIKAVLDGELGSCAINHDVALALSIAEDAEQFPISLLYRQMVAGKVDVDGKLTISPEYKEFLEETLDGI